MSSLINSIDFPFVLGALIKVIIFWITIMIICAYAVYAERRVLAVIQNRLGPNRVGWQGLLQPFADLIKFIFKEDIIPMAVNRALYVSAPIIALVPAMMVLIVYPFGPDNLPLPGGEFLTQTVNDLVTKLGLGWNVDLRTVNLHVTHFNVGILYIFAMTGLGVYGIVVAGWASNSKYSLMGGLRSSAQMVSYELGLSLSVVAILLMAGTLDLTEIVKQQSGWGGMRWNIFGGVSAGTGLKSLAMAIPAIFAFFIYLISAIAETNRVPFDLPEAETELVAGFHTEYSALKFALFFIAEYVNMTTVSVLATSLFLGGWNGPFINVLPWLGPIYFLGKVFFFLFLYIWLRGTLPRLRYDQLMNFGWKFLLPAALFNIALAAIIAVLIY